MCAAHTKQQQHTPLQPERAGAHVPPLTDTRTEPGTAAITIAVPTASANCAPYARPRRRTRHSARHAGAHPGRNATGRAVVPGHPRAQSLAPHEWQPEKRVERLHRQPLVCNNLARPRVSAATLRHAKPCGALTVRAPKGSRDANASPQSLSASCSPRTRTVVGARHAAGPRHAYPHALQARRRARARV